MRILFLALMVLVVSCAAPDPKAKEENYFKHTKKAKKDCDGPYGTVPHGKKIKFFNMLVAEKSEKCKSEIRVCKDGVLSGSFYFPGCTEVAQAGK